MVTLCSFNANNLFVRYRFGTDSPGAPASAPAPPDPINTPTTSSPKSGFLPKYEAGSFQIFNADQRKLAATALARGDDHPLPDLVVLQEIESMIALRVFNERHLGSHYDHAPAEGATLHAARYYGKHSSSQVPMPESISGCRLEP